MRTRVIRMVIAVVVALAVTMPVGARAKPMPAADMNGKTIEQPCQNCPQPDQTGGTTPDKMPACQMFACVGSAVLLPAVAIAPGRVHFRVAYLGTPPAHWTQAAPAPDPFPPKSIVLQ
jgi:hypothetical protein